MKSSLSRHDSNFRQILRKFAGKIEHKTDGRPLARDYADGLPPVLMRRKLEAKITRRRLRTLSLPKTRRQSHKCPGCVRPEERFRFQALFRQGEARRGIEIAEIACAGTFHHVLPSTSLA